MNSRLMWPAREQRTLPGINIGGTVELDDVAVTMVEAKHSAGAEGKSGAQYAGVAAGFVLTIATGPCSITPETRLSLAI